MRYIQTVLFALLAVPALAQQERECRGKQPFDLGTGVRGCLLELGTSKITTTRTRDDGASSSVKSAVAGEIEVLAFGAYNGSKRVIGPRLRAICQAFLPSLQAELAGKRFHRIVVVMIWPRVANPGDFVPVSDAKVAVQFGFSSSSCRGVRFFE